MARRPTVDPELDDDFSDVPPATADDRAPGEKTSSKKNNGKSETEPIGQEIQKSGQTSGNPENQKTRNHDNSDGTVATVETSDYLGAVYGGFTDPYEDFTKGSTQMPLCVWRALKAAAPMEGVSVQQLLTDIVLGKTKPLPKSYPDLLQRFYDMARQGKLKR